MQSPTKSEAKASPTTSTASEPEIAAAPAPEKPKASPPPAPVSTMAQSVAHLHRALQDGPDELSENASALMLSQLILERGAALAAIDAKPRVAAAMAANKPPPEPPTLDQMKVLGLEDAATMSVPACLEFVENWKRAHPGCWPLLRMGDALRFAMQCRMHELPVDEPAGYQATMSRIAPVAQQLGFAQPLPLVPRQSAGA